MLGQGRQESDSPPLAVRSNHKYNASEAPEASPLQWGDGDLEAGRAKFELENFGPAFLKICSVDTRRHSHQTSKKS